MGSRFNTKQGIEPFSAGLNRFGTEPPEGLEGECLTALPQPLLHVISTYLDLDDARSLSSVARQFHAPWPWQCAIATLLRASAIDADSSAASSADSSASASAEESSLLLAASCDHLDLMAFLALARRILRQRQSAAIRGPAVRQAASSVSVCWGQDPMYWTRMAPDPGLSTLSTEVWRLRNVCWLDMAATERLQNASTYLLLARVRYAGARPLLLHRRLTVEGWTGGSASSSISEAQAPTAASSSSLSDLALQPVAGAQWGHIDAVPWLALLIGVVHLPSLPYPEEGAVLSQAATATVRWCLFNHSPEWKTGLVLDAWCSVPVSCVEAMGMDMAALQRDGYVSATPSFNEHICRGVTLWSCGKRKWATTGGGSRSAHASAHATEDSTSARPAVGGAGASRSGTDDEPESVSETYCTIC